MNLVKRTVKENRYKSKLTHCIRNCFILKKQEDIADNINDTGTMDLFTMFLMHQISV